MNRLLTIVLVSSLVILTLSACQQTPKLPEQASQFGQVLPDSVSSQALSTLQATSVPATGLKVIATETGKLAFSADGAGSNNPSGAMIQVNKPNLSASVRRAVFACASYAARVINDADVALDGNPIIWTQNVMNSVGTMPYFDSVLSDITNLVKPKIDAAAVGQINFLQTEILTTTIDGCALYVIFDDPSQVNDSTIVLLFGGQRTSGDSFSINLAQPIDKIDPNLNLGLSLATSYGYQGALSTLQYSQIDINGNHLSTASGGQDDCDIFAFGSNECATNGALMTVGGINDSLTNPTNPLASATINAHSDDELYNLLPFVNNGDTALTISTKNPSNDDNIFAAALVSSLGALGTPTNMPPTVYADHNPVAVNKGNLALNTGTFSDPDSDAVTLSASTGSLSQDAATGVWNWSFDTSSSSGNQLVTITARDTQGNLASTNFLVNVLEPNRPPTVTANINPVIVDEGKKAGTTLSFFDPDGDSVSFSASIGRISDDSITGIWSWSFDTVDGPAQSQIVTITATDSRGASASTSFPLIVNNLLPIINSGGVTTSANAIAINTSLTASASFKDGGVVDTHTAQWNWGDGTVSTATLTQGAGSGSVTDSHVYTKTGSFIIQLTVTDKDGGVAVSNSRAIAVTNSQSAKGKDRIDSPAGSYVANLTLTGKADFEFASAFSSGAKTPSGKVNLKLSAVNFNFSATAQTSLVVNGSTATIKGTGTVNALGNYGFLIVVTDGGVAPQTDLFRIKIWDINNANTVVYDNQKGQPNTSTAGSTVSGNSITVSK